MERVERAMFGFTREDDGKWVDGILQRMADIQTVTAFALKVLAPCIGLIALSTFASMLHNYGVAESLGHFAKGLIGH